MLAALTLFACPICAGPYAVRDVVFGPDFWPNLAVTALPFGVFAAVAAAAHGPARGGR